WGIDAVEGTGGEDHGARARAPGERPVIERFGDRGGRLRVVGQHHVDPGLVALVGTELLLELGEKIGLGRLATTAGAEGRTDERRHRNDVVHREARPCDAVRTPKTVGPVRRRPRTAGAAGGMGRPCPPYLSTRSWACCVTNASHSGLGSKCWPLVTSPKALMLGTSATATRAG